MPVRLAVPTRVLQIAFGLTATLAGLDKYFNLLADWGGYVSPTMAAMLPVSVSAFMMAVGVIEVAAGALVLGVAPRIGAYVVSAWLVLIAVNLIVAGYLDVAVRDLVMAVGAFTLARLIEVRETTGRAATGG